MHLILFLPFLAVLSVDGFNRFAREANGCGPVHFNIDRFLRDIGEEILIECCNQHDLCYETCGRKQITCDTDYFDCMNSACRQLSPPLESTRCQNNAKILFWFVFFGGQSSYQQAQQQNHC